MKILEYLKGLLSPKAILLQAINALDLLVPLLANEMNKAKDKFNDLNTMEKSQWLIDRVQSFLKQKFNLGE